MGTRPLSLWLPCPRKRAGSDRSLHSPLCGLCVTLKDTLGAQTIFLNLVLIAQAWFCCNRSSLIEERKEERGGSGKTKDHNSTEAHGRLRIFRGRAQQSKAVSSPTLDLYPTPSYRVKKGKGNEIEMKNI